MTLQTSEQRKHRRFKINGDASFLLTAKSPELGALIDISMGGIACCYATKRTTIKDKVAHGVLFDDDNIIIEELPMKFIEEYPLAVNASGSDMTIWRRCFQFGKITPQQADQLEHFIATHTNHKD